MTRRTPMDGLPHLRAGDPFPVVIQAGPLGPIRVSRVRTACGQEIAPTLVTMRADRVRCPACQQAHTTGGPR